MSFLGKLLSGMSGGHHGGGHGGNSGHGGGRHGYRDDDYRNPPPPIPARLSSGGTSCPACSAPNL